MSEKENDYVIGWDQGRPGGDKTVWVIFDRIERKIVNIEELDEPETMTAAEFEAAIEKMHREQLQKMKRFNAAMDHTIREMAGQIDDQGDAQVIDPPALPAPEKT